MERTKGTRVSIDRIHTHVRRFEDDGMAKLHALPKEVADAVRSQTVLNGLDQVVEELACNALDAGATCVRIWADLQNRRLEVHDDGHGMGREDLLECGKRHCTSKIRTMRELQDGPETLGFRGEAMASLAELSTLSIRSRKKGSFETYCKTVQGNVVLRFGIEKTTREEAGTSVYVENFQFNRPVRRKQVNERVLRKEADSIRHTIQCLAMSHQECRFQVEEKRRGDLVRHQIATDPFDLFFTSLGKSNAEYFKRASVRDSNWALDGVISLPPHGGREKTKQYLFVNRKVVRKSPIHQMLDQAFLCVCSSLERRAGNTETGTVISAGAALPYYVLFIRCPSGSFDLLQEQDKSSMEFVDANLVERLLTQWLLEAWAERLPPKHFSSNSNAGFASILGTKKLKCTRLAAMQIVKADEALPLGERIGGKGLGLRKSLQSTLIQFNRTKKRLLPEGESGRLQHDWEDFASNDDSILAKWGRNSKALKCQTDIVCCGCKLEGPSELSSRWKKLVQSEILELAYFRQLDSLGEVIPTTISRSALKAAHTYCQVDRKFILARAHGMLFIVDQHAADERVRLEHLQEELRSRLCNEGTSLAQEVSPPIEIELTFEEFTCAELYKERLERWGWIVRHQADHGERAVQMPAKCYIVSVPCICGAMLGEAFLREYLHQLSETCGAQAIPCKINALLKSKACRGAVMFGDELSKEQSKRLVEKLAATHLSLQCAHGRPTMVPLVQIDALQRAVQTRRSVGRICNTQRRISLKSLKQQLETP